ncbi:UNKNOWN [Stylonychia lemnae]|uniref:Uncharacterized protein n=1 Tax=Stylonychia lemnae TaxID=5949 RepID=A0A078BB97_STYLE|nr:UNKNOWN [Stylonychia lemnae]|eukprot:CDW91466.1 UNKNOWN [Stylonychia lemnae]
MIKYLLIFFFLLLQQISVSSIKSPQHRLIQNKIATQVQAQNRNQQQSKQAASLQKIFDSIENISSALSQMSKVNMTFSEMIKANVTTDLMAGNPENIKTLTQLIQKLFNETVANGYDFYFNNTFADEQTLNKTLGILSSLQDQVNFIQMMAQVKFGNTASQIKDYNCRNNLISAQSNIANTYKLFLAAYGRGMQTQEYQLYQKAMKDSNSLAGYSSFLVDSLSNKSSYCRIFDILQSGTVSNSFVGLPVMLNMANSYLLIANQAFIMQITYINSNYVDITRSDLRVNYSASLQMKSYQVPYCNAYLYWNIIQDWQNMTKVNIVNLFNKQVQLINSTEFAGKVMDAMALIKPGFYVDVHLFSDNTAKTYPDGQGKKRISFFSATQINNRQEQRQYYFAITIAPKDDYKNYTAILESKFSNFREYLNNNQQTSTRTMNSGALRTVNADCQLDGALVFWNWSGYYPTVFEYPLKTESKNRYNYLNGRMACEHQDGFGFCIFV